MIQIEESVIKKIILHRVGFVEDEPLLNENLFEFDNEGEEIVLKKLLLKPFLSQNLTSEFSHDLELNFNVLFNISKSVYNDDNFVENSKKIAKHLLSSSKHPNIKEGELIIVKFDDLKFNNTFYEGIGIYKFEDKENFIETSLENNQIKLKFKQGLNNRKPDKACLILFTEEPYTLFVIDSGKETDYWQNDFIKHKSKNDFVNNTNDLLIITKNFVTQKLDDDYEISKADKIDLLNRSMKYFKEKETFDIEEFGNEVIGNAEGIESFKNYKKNYEEEYESPIADNFEIAESAVKKQARAYKSVLKLDKNFHIYIHGNKDMIEKGYDDDKSMNFYKVYFREEE